MIPIGQIEPNKGQIKGLPKNPRLIRDEHFKKLLQSIKDNPEMLYLRELLVYPHQGKYVVIGGNMRLMAMRDLKYTEAPCKVIPEDTTVEQLKAYTIKDNAAYGEWDYDLLANEWDYDLLNDWCIDIPDTKSVNPTAEAHDDDFDPDKPVETVCKKGDIWKLGNHRLMCGDSTDAASVALLMDGKKADIAFSSPPYNAGFGKCITKDNGRSKYTNGDDDNKTQEEYEEFLSKYIENATENSEYNFVNIQMLANNKHALLKCIASHIDTLGDIIIWDKQRSQPAAAANVLNSEFEFVFVFSKKGNRNIGCIPFHGTLKNIVHIPPKKNEYSDEHNAVFPMELPSHFINSFSRKSVLDLFGGSGTTLIAAEQLDRRCYMMEFDPHYCDVIIARWEKFTGQKAKLITNTKTAEP